MADQYELLDVNSDPIEEHNMFIDPDHRDRVRLVAAKIRRSIKWETMLLSRQCSE